VAKRPPAFVDCEHEGEGLAAWKGRGAVELLDRSVDGVLLIERAEPGLPVTSDAVLGSAMARLWMPPPAGIPWRRFDDVVVGWRASIEQWRSVLGDDVVRSALDAELDGPAGWCLLHGDCHHGNVLDGGTRGWLAIDPQPLIGPPAYDLATAVWNGPEVEVEVEDRMAGLAAAAGIGVDALRSATRFRAALSSAWSLDGGEPLDTGVPARALAVARALATTVPGP
jgi:streptomycin 6-kinase